MLWNVKGIATKNFVAIFAATGHVAKAAAILADSRCHPVIGAMRYAMPKRYKLPDRAAPVIRLIPDKYHVNWGL